VHQWAGHRGPVQHQLPRRRAVHSAAKLSAAAALLHARAEAQSACRPGQAGRLGVPQAGADQVIRPRANPPLCSAGQSRSESGRGAPEWAICPRQRRGAPMPWAPGGPGQKPRRPAPPTSGQRMRPPSLRPRRVSGRLAIADMVVDNSGSLAELDRQAGDLQRSCGGVRTWSAQDAGAGVIRFPAGPQCSHTFLRPLDYPTWRQLVSTEVDA
jgi:hypothetical protein